MRRKRKKSQGLFFLVVLFFAILGIVFAIKFSRENSVLIMKKQVAADVNDILEQADKLSEGYFYDEAASLLTKFEFSSNSKIQAKLRDIDLKKSSLEPYDGKIYHIFFHSLIIDPKLAFSSGKEADGYNRWMITADECKKILAELYLNNYILVDIHSFYQKDSAGNLQPAKPLLPPEKKPLIISQDDVNYYEYMSGDGFASKLISDEDGNIKTLVIDKNGTENMTDDGDLVPILDNFIKKHPSFSYRGAKGILAVTGYEGALGYRITKSDTNVSADQMERENLVRTAKALREDGWQFACHSYTHNDFFLDQNPSIKLISQDLTWWRTYIEPYVGYTDIFVSPFGVHFSPSSEQMKAVTDAGFEVFCPVDAKMQSNTYSNIFISTRLNIDGNTLLLKPSEAQIFFDAKNILDPTRPCLKE